MEFIGILCLILLATTIGSHLSRRFGVPAVIGQLLVGVLLGGAGLGWVHPNILVHDFSEIGVILLMFLAGLESDLSLLKKYFATRNVRCFIRDHTPRIIWLVDG